MKLSFDTSLTFKTEKGETCSKSKVNYKNVQYQYCIDGSIATPGGNTDTDRSWCFIENKGLEWGWCEDTPDWDKAKKIMSDRYV